MMKRFEVGDRVRIDIPDQPNPDFECLHNLMEQSSKSFRMTREL